MGRVISSFSKGLIILLAIGGMLIYMSGTMFLTSVKPAKSFDDLWETKAEEGMHIKGDVNLSLECFSYEETWKEGNGTRTAAKTSAYYYAVPVGDIMVALEVPTKDYDAMEKLVDESFDYLNGGAEPVSGVAVEGRVSKMESDLEGMFKEYLVSVGYTEEDISEMGQLLMIEQPHSMMTIQIMFGVGVLLILIAVLIFVIRFKKSGTINQSGVHTEYMNTDYQSTDYQSTDSQNMEYQSVDYNSESYNGENENQGE